MSKAGERLKASTHEMRRMLREAKSVAAKMGYPGCYAFPWGKERPPTKLAANGLDVILDLGDDVSS